MRADLTRQRVHAVHDPRGAERKQERADDTVLGDRDNDVRGALQEEPVHYPSELESSLLVD